MRPSLESEIGGYFLVFSTCVSDGVFVFCGLLFLDWEGTLASGGVLFSQSPPRPLFSLGLPGKPA